MEFHGEFTAPGEPDEVMRRFIDIERMARCMPGAALEGRDEEGNWIGVMTVAFGPKKLKFKGRMTCDFDVPGQTGTLKGRGAADARAARVAFETRFRVAAAPAGADGGPMSQVTIDSTAELGGVIADFARTGGAALADVIMQDFARNLAADLARADGAALAAAQPLSATKVVWSAMKSRFAQS